MEPGDTPRPKPDYAGRALHHGKVAEATRRKIQRLYGIADAWLAWPKATECEDWVGKLNEIMEGQLTSRYWRTPRDEALQHSGITNEPTAVAAIDDIGRGIMQRYIEAFNLRRVIAQQPKQSLPAEHKNFVSALEPDKALTEILVNHLSNQAEAELCAAGFTPRDAHTLHSKLLGIVINACACGSELKRYAEVVPAQGSAFGKTPEEIDGRIDELNGHWRKQHALYKLHTADFKDGFFR